MIRGASAALWLGFAELACAPTPRLEIMREVDAARGSVAVQAAAKSAPQAYADAELRRTQAERAFADDKPASAQILSEQALAAYTRATVQARLARAEVALVDEAARLAKATAQQSALDSQQQRLLLEAEALETRLKVARAAEPLPVSAPAVSAEREQARLAAVKALLSQAKLLCMAARLLEPAREGVGPLLGKVDDLSGKLRTPPAPIDDAVAVRSGCLKELTLARRPATQKRPAAGVADALLSELSDSNLLPFRDDRGVVVTLRALFNGKEQLNSEAASELDTLGKVGKAHPEFPLLVVLHAARGNPSTRDATEAAAVVEVLKKSGAPSVEAETAGASLPILDPARPGASERNARVEIVFVAPSSS
jgi:hypothetical protein